MKEFDQKTRDRLNTISNHASGNSCGCEYGCYGVNKEKAAELLFEWTRAGIFGKKAFLEGLKILGAKL